jgi:hypothetical protein
MISDTEEYSIATFGCQVNNQEEVEEVLSIVCGLKETDPPAIVKKGAAQKPRQANNLK